MEPFLAFQYAELFLITEMRDGQIYRIKSTGKFVPRDRRMRKGEQYASVDTRSPKIKREKNEKGFEVLLLSMWED